MFMIASHCKLPHRKPIPQQTFNHYSSISQKHFPQPKFGNPKLQKESVMLRQKTATFRQKNANRAPNKKQLKCDKSLDMRE